MIICFVGDIMLSENQLNNGYIKKQSNPKDWFKYVKNYINDSDYIIGNFETNIYLKNKLSGYPTFNSPKEYLDDLCSEIHFNALSVCNNHCLDNNEEGLKSTIKYITNKNIQCIGVYDNYKTKQPLIIKHNNQKIAILNYCEKINDNKICNNLYINIFNLNELQNDIENLKNKVSTIILFIHYGKEYSDKPTDEQQNLFHTIIEMGIDHIICSHSHIPQLTENYSYDGKNHFIVYSLGNFISDQRRLFVDTGKIVKLNINDNNATINEQKIFTSCPDFNNINSYRVINIDNQLNMIDLSDKEIYKINCIK